MTRRSDIGTAVIGSGFIGTVHIEALRRIGVRVVGLLDATPELGDRRARELGLPAAYESLDALLADPEVRVVHVTSPNELHHPQVKQILAAGRHVAEYSAVTHCYQRPRRREFPGNLYAMIHRGTWEETQELFTLISSDTGLGGGHLLCSLREFKKPSPLGG